VIKIHKNDLDLFLKKYMREPEILSKAHHHNIIKYYDSWIEVSFKE